MMRTTRRRRGTAHPGMPRATGDRSRCDGEKELRGDDGENKNIVRGGEVLKEVDL
jgi:hypothetical protein